MNEISFGSKHNKSLTSMNYAIPISVWREEFNEYLNFVESDWNNVAFANYFIFFVNSVIFATFYSNSYPDIQYNHLSMFVK